MILNKRSKAPTPTPADTTYLFGPTPTTNKPIGQFGIEKKKDSDAIKVSLSDCLACSGCITSAETVLLEAQSIDEFKQQVAACAQSGGRRAVVVSVAPQSRASLAYAAGLSTLDAAKRLTGFFKVMGVARVYDTTAARDFSLLEAREEFVERFRASKAANDDQNDQNNQNNATPNPLPVLASACPGWVCYAEKQSPAVLPHISHVKSPQQIMGTVVKRRVAAALGLDPGAVFHVAVMPCYDKKLEASREDFREGDGDGAPVPDVDCVLTTGEVAELLAGAFGVTVAEKDGYSSEAGGLLEGAGALARCDPAPLDGWLASLGTGVRPRTMADMDMDTDADMDDADVDASNDDEWVWGCDSKEGGGGSGGYLEHVFRYAAKTVFGVVVDGPLEYVVPRARNPDLKEVVLRDTDGVVLMKFAQAYGFRNIQNMVRKIKPTAHDIHLGGGRDGCGYDYVEIMACPSGCLNGGGQLPPPPALPAGTMLDPSAPMPATLGGMTAKELVDELETRYRWGSGTVEARAPDQSPEIAEAYREWVMGGVGSAGARALFHTRYHDRGAEAAAAAGGTVAIAAQLKLTSDW